MARSCVRGRKSGSCLMKLIQQHLPLSFMETHAEQTPVTVGWGGVGGECGGHLKTQLEIQGSKEEKKNGHNRNSHIPNITPRLHQSRSSGMWETVDVNARECVLWGRLTCRRRRAAAWTRLWACMAWARLPCLCLRENTKRRDESLVSHPCLTVSSLYMNDVCV